MPLTLQVLHLLRNLREVGRTPGPHLIVVPKPAVQHWETALETHFPDLPFIQCVAGNDKACRELLSQGKLEALSGGVVLTTPEHVQQDWLLLAGIYPSRKVCSCTGH